MLAGTAQLNLVGFEGTVHLRGDTGFAEVVEAPQSGKYHRLSQYYSHHQLNHNRKHIDTLIQNRTKCQAINASITASPRKITAIILNILSKFSLMEASGILGQRASPKSSPKQIPKKWTNPACVNPIIMRRVMTVIMRMRQNWAAQTCLRQLQCRIRAATCMPMQAHRHPLKPSSFPSMETTATQLAANPATKATMMLHLQQYQISYMMKIPKMTFMTMCLQLLCRNIEVANWQKYCLLCFTYSTSKSHLSSQWGCCRNWVQPPGEQTMREVTKITRQADSSSVVIEQNQK